MTVYSAPQRDKKQDPCSSCDNLATEPSSVAQKSLALTGNVILAPLHAADKAVKKTKSFRTKPPSVAPPAAPQEAVDILATVRDETPAPPPTPTDASSDPSSSFLTESIANIYEMLYAGAAKTLRVSSPITECFLGDAVLHSVLLGLAATLAVGPALLPSGWCSFPIKIPLAYAFVAVAMGYELGRQRGPRHPPEAIVATPEQMALPQLETARAKDLRQESAPKKKFKKKRWLRKQTSLSWRFLKPARSKQLLAWMLQDPQLRRKKHQTLPEAVSFNYFQRDSVHIYDLTTTSAESLVEMMEPPLLEMLALDVLTSANGAAEDCIGTHPFLLKCGLRKKIRAMVNIIAQPANFLLHMTLPDWFQDWDTIVEEPDDPDNVKALKRFLNGDDAYRNARLKLLPVIVEGPAIVKMLVRRNMAISLPNLVPINWIKRREEMNSKGGKLSSMLEIELDCISNKCVRNIANTLFRNLNSMVVDVAIVIQKEGEPSACIAMWRFDRIDISKCPALPVRHITEQEASLRASMSTWPLECK